MACVQENAITLAEKMNLSTDAVICNQCQEYAFTEFERRGRRIRVYAGADRGVGLNRNRGLSHAEAEYILLSDEDIVYDDDYEEKVLREFERNPDADVLMFNVRVSEERKTYENTAHKRVRWYNYGRYPTYSMALKTKSLRKANVWFSLLFGGGAPYSNGEDSLFISDCLKKGLKIYGVPVTIGFEDKRKDGASTWFSGYNEKFFYDRGVLFSHLYGRFATAAAVRFIAKYRKKMCNEIPAKQAFSLIRKGIREA